MADANVLIDYARSDVTVLKLVSRCLGPLMTLASVLDEVDELDREGCARLEVGIVDASLEHMVRAANLESSTSFTDRLCLVVCSERRWVCVTNDLALQRLCRAHGVEARFGLRLLVDLAANQAIDREQAVDIARAMQQQNPMHINESVMERFFRALANV